jgi:cell division protein FtsB
MTLPRFRLNLFVLALIAALAILQYRLWFESGGIRDVIRLKSTLSQQEGENEKLRKRNNDLLAQIQRLQNSQDTAESRARSELGMIKKGETFYQVVR